MSEAKLFAAFCEHGKIRAASVDDMDGKMLCAADVVGYKKRGFTVKRIERPSDNSLWKCEPCDEKRKARKL